LIAQAQQEFQIYQQAETEKRNYEIGKISQKLGIDAQKMTIEVGALEK
jgi:replicative DNA helicase